MGKKIFVSKLNKTWIFDLDGTICVHNGYKMESGDLLLDGAKQFFENIDENDMVIIITARKDTYKKETEDFLKKNNIRYDYIIYNAPYGERILVNDKKPSGLLTALSLNTNRDEFLNVNFIQDEKL